MPPMIGLLFSTLRYSQLFQNLGYRPTQQLFRCIPHVMGKGLKLKCKAVGQLYVYTRKPAKYVGGERTEQENIFSTIIK